MIVVVNLIKSVFVYLFMFMFGIEIIFLIASIISYNSSLKENLVEINKKTLYYHKNINEKFLSVLDSEYSNIKSDLLLIAKHLFPMHLTLSNKNSDYYFRFSLNSSMMKTLESNDPFRYYSNDSSAKISQLENLYQYKLNKINLTNPQILKNETMLMEELLNDNDFNNISVYSSTSLTQKAYYNNLKIYMNYLITILKSIMVRNSLYERFYTSYLKFHIILNDESLFEYPANDLNKATAMNKLNFINNPSGKRCEIETLASCVSPLSTIGQQTTISKDNYDIIKFDPIKISGDDSLISRACIKINFLSLDVINEKSFACIEFNLEVILDQISQASRRNSNILKNRYVVFNLFGIQNDTTTKSMITPLYYHSISSYSNLKNIYNNTPIELHHGLTVALGLNKTNSDDVFYINKNLETIKNNIYTNISLKTSPSEMNNNKTNTTATTTNKTINMPKNVANQDISLYYKNELGKIREDNITLTISAMDFNMYPYDLKTYMLDTDMQLVTPNSAGPMFYSLVSTLYGNDMISNTISWVLILKSLRSWFFFIFLILLSTIIFYIVMEVYLKYFLDSLKVIKDQLRDIVKSKNNNSSGLNEVSKNLIENRSSSDNPENDESPIIQKMRNYARNKETKDLFETLEFLNKIIIMKQTNENIHNNSNKSYQEASEVYKKFEEQFNSLKSNNAEGFRNFKLKIIYNSYKRKSYAEAYSNLDIYIKSVMDEISNSNLESNILDIKTTHLEDYSYINDFTDFSKLNEVQKEKKKINLKIALNNGYFYYGFIKYKQAEEKYIDLKKKNKDEEAESKFIEKDRLDNIFNTAIFYFNEAIKICKSENMNRIKVIIMTIYVARCHYFRKEFSEAAVKIRDAMIEFGNFNMNFFDPEKSENKILAQVDPRIMIIVNANIFEQLFFNMSKIANKLQRKKLSAWLMNKMIEHSYYLNKKILCSVYQRIRKIIFNDDIMDKPINELRENPKYNNLTDQEIYLYKKSKSLVERIISRIEVNKASSKYICFLTTENLLKDFACPIDLKSFLMRCIEKYLKESDIIGYMQANYAENIFLEKSTKRNIEEFKLRNDLFEYNNKNKNLSIDSNNEFEKRINLKNLINLTSNNIKIDFPTAFWAITKQIKYLEDSKHENLDKIIFCFIKSDDFNLDTRDDGLFEELLMLHVAVYCFCFDDIDEKRLPKIKEFIKNLDEGHLIIVKNYEIIERAFQNISFLQENKSSVLKTKYSNHNFII